MLETVLLNTGISFLGCYHLIPELNRSTESTSEVCITEAYMQPQAWHRVQTGKEEYPVLCRLSARFPLRQNAKDITQMRTGRKKGNSEVVAWWDGPMALFSQPNCPPALQRQVRGRNQCFVRLFQNSLSVSCCCRSMQSPPQEDSFPNSVCQLHWQRKNSLQ